MKNNRGTAKKLSCGLLCLLMAASIAFATPVLADEPDTEVSVTAQVQDVQNEDAAQTEQKDDADTAEKSDDNAKLPEKVEIMDRSGGMLGFLYDWFGTALKWLYGVCGNYIVAILVFALAIKVVLFPLSIKQQKNSQKMAKLAPRQEAIRKKYAGRTDKKSQMKMNEEMQQLYADEKFNPMGGCLPMLLQLPVILALYNAITNPLTSFLGYTGEKLTHLSEVFTQNVKLFEGIKATITETDAISRIANAKDPAVIAAFGEETHSTISAFYESFKVGPLNLMDNPEVISLLVIVPVLVFASSFLSTKIIRKFTYNPNAGQMDASMKVMDWTMPLMILWFSFQVPALVGIYWVFQNVISIGQQYVLYKMFPVKGPTPEEIREAELLMRGKKAKNDEEKVEKTVNQPVSKAALKKKKENSPFIYAKKGIKEKYLAHVKAVGKAPKAKKRP
ncbi:MAG: YidC/Oxa1 family membrane protein insertase [Clostridia bacterium]|nr:YidC/Oxa1 family membrane protein insertase [Clostridia bacterium]